jgi:outer membrane protein TolC
MLGLVIPLALTASASAGSFAELVDHAALSSTTAQSVELDARIMRSQVGSSASRLLPNISLSESLTSIQIDSDRYSTEEQTDEECELERGRPCDPFVMLDGVIAIPATNLSHSVSVTGRQTVWSSSSVMGLLETKKQQQLRDLSGVQELEGQAWELVDAYVDLQFAVDDLALQRRTVELSAQSHAATRASHAAGTATDLDLELAALDERQARVDLAQAERAVPRTLRGLWDTAGYSGPGTQQVCPMMAVTDHGGPLELDGATSLQISERSVELDRLGRTESRLSFLPTLTANGGLSWSGAGDGFDAALEDFGFNYWYVGGSLSWTLFSGLSRYHDNRAATFDVRLADLEHAQELRDLSLSDAEYAADLRDLAEDLELLELEVTLQERSTRATLSRYEDGGQVPLDAVLSAQSGLESLRSQVLSTRRQQVLTMARRWIDAGYTSDLLTALTSSDRVYAAAGRCTELTP